MRRHGRRWGRAGLDGHECPVRPESPEHPRGMTGTAGRADAASLRATPSGTRQGPLRRRWLTRSSVRIAGTATLAALVALVATPADGGTSGLAPRLAKAAGLLQSASHAGKAFTGFPAVGALFTSDSGKLGSHFCTASVTDSPHGNLLITAAHCVTGVQGSIVFVPGYSDGSTPYGVWNVTRVFTDPAWQLASDPDDDVAFLEVSQPGSSVPIEDVTGAEELSTGKPAGKQVQVIGYPNTADQPITCRAPARPFGTSQMEFDCDGYTDGTSGGPFLADVDQTTGQGTVIGVIGGYLQGGDTPSQSFSITFGRDVSALYRTAIAGS